MDLIILAIAAGFILYKLFTVLGQRTGMQSDDLPEESNKNNVINIQQKSEKNKEQTPPSKSAADVSIESLEPHLRRSVQEVTRLDPEFSLADFKEGASFAFEIIVDSFSKGDLKALKPLLSKSLYDVFEDAVKEREKRGETYENTLVRIEKVDVEKIDLDGTVAKIRVEFTSEQIPVTRNKAGDIIDGNPNQIDQIIDYWTFERNMRSKDPNWVLTSTQM